MNKSYRELLVGVLLSALFVGNALAAVPVARNTSVTVLTNRMSWIAVDCDDADFESTDQTQALTIHTPPAHGTLEAGSIKFYYQPVAGYLGQDSFTWSVSDGSDDSNIATCTVTVASSPVSLDKLIVLVVNDLLLPEITNEVDRMKLDLENEGYAVKIKPWDSANAGYAGASNLWDYLVSEYDSSTNDPAKPVLNGSIFIGNTPLFYKFGTWNDRIFWNMASYDRGYYDPYNFAVWTSRIYIGATSTSERFGDEVTLIKRNLQANHDYRTSAARLPNTAYVYDNAYGQAKVPKKQKVWPNFIEAGTVTKLLPDVSEAFLQGCDFYQEESHGNGGAYNLWVNLSTEILHNITAQARVVLASSCDSGVPGGIVNNHIFTRNGNCLLAVGASVTVSTRTVIATEDYTADRTFRNALRKGKTWGDSIVEKLPFNEGALIFYGDLSIGAMNAPHNNIPLVNSMTADVTSGVAPLTVNFSSSSSDSDDSIVKQSWFLEGVSCGMVEPTVTTVIATNPAITYLLAHNYQPRIQVTDQYKAIAHEQAEIIVKNAPDKPLRVNCGYHFQRGRYYHSGYDYTDASTNVWLHDQYAYQGNWGVDSKFYSSSMPRYIRPVENTEDDILYHSGVNAGGKLAYTIPLPNATYTVKLGFADMQNTTVSKRFLNVYLNDELKLENYDIIDDAGGPDTAVSKVFSVAVTNGMLNIYVEKNTNSPAGYMGDAILNCFEIFSVNPTPIISATPMSGTVPLTVNFDGSGSFDPNGSLKSYDWDFGDGNTASVAALSHTYTNGGIFTATLTIVNDNDVPASDSVIIMVDDPAEADPVINSFSPVGAVTLAIGTNQVFSVNATDSAGQTLSYYWDIDGEPIPGNNANSYNYVPAFSTEESDLGSRVVTVMISDGLGGFISHSWNVEVVPGPAPVAVAVSDITTCDMNTTISFSGSQSSGNGSEILTYNWDLDGCGKYTGMDISHEFTYGGMFAVQLAITNGCGGSDIDEILITVNDPFEPKPIVTATNPVSGMATVESSGSQLFSVAANDPEGQSLEYYWTVDGEVVGDTNSASYEYTGMSDADIGEHIIEVSVWDGHGGATVISWTVNVAAARNYIPYEESFEAYEVGTYLTATNGWWAEDYNATIVTNDPALISALTTYLQTHSAPLVTNHTKILKFNYKWTNLVDSSKHPAEDVKIDFMVTCDHRKEMPETVAGDEQMGVGVNSNGLLMVMARESLAADPAWHILSGMTPVSTGEWARLTFTLRYSGATNMFQVQVDDGDPVIDGIGYEDDGSKPGSWFVMVDQSKDYMTYLHGEGDGNIDDVKVTLADAAPDNDGDGIPDDLDDDDDNDGMTDADELAAGTDPMDADSSLEMSSVSGSGSGAVIIFDSVSGKIYAVEFKDDLLAPEWNTLTSGVFSADGTVEVYDNGEVDQRFYRVKLVE